MSNELVVGLNLPTNVHAEDEKSWGTVITAASFLPRVNLYGANSNLVVGGKIQMGHFGLAKSKEQVEDLGMSFDCLPLSYRFKAMRITADDVVSIFNPKDPEFLKIQQLSDTPDTGCMYGIEFLVWLPALRVFATYFLNSKTARREAPNLKALLKRGATVRSNLITKGKYRWHGPVVTSCSTPFEDLPSNEEIVEQAERFANPKDSELEKAEVAATERPQ